MSAFAPGALRRLTSRRVEAWDAGLGGDTRTLGQADVQIGVRPAAQYFDGASGFMKHLNLVSIKPAAAQARDRSRDRRASLSGFVVLRFTGSELWKDPLGCAEQVMSWFTAEIVRDKPLEASR